MQKKSKLVASVLAAALGTVLLASPATGKRIGDTAKHIGDAAQQYWQDRIDYLLAPDFQLFPGDYAAGIPDTLVHHPNKNLNLYTDIAPTNADGTVNAVVEIPAGTHAKWETDTESGRIFWELKNGAPRIVKYLGYPGDYGMVPQTLGGDGDPLDVVLIGSMNLRGSVVPARVIGVFHLIDGGEVDDKLIAVVPGEPMGEVGSMAELNASYPGVSSILEIWFTNYKGPGGGLASGGFGDVDEAQSVLDAAVAAY